MLHLRYGVMSISGFVEKFVKNGEAVIATQYFFQRSEIMVIG